MDASLDTDIAIHLYESGKERDYSWIMDICNQQIIDYRFKMQKLKEYLSGMD